MSSSTSVSLLPPPADLGITPDLYAYCYCEENVRRAIIKILGQAQLSMMTTPNRKIEPFAVFCSSYVQDEPQVVFPGSWLPHSSITLVIDSRTKEKISWDYHVFVVIRVTTTATATSREQQPEGKDSSTPATTPSPPTNTIIQHFVADFDSGLSNKGTKGKVQKFVPLDEYCSVTFSKASKEATRLRVVAGCDYWDKFRSTRAHMLPPQALRSWLQDKSRRNMPAPNELLMKPPHPTDGPICGDNEGVDLAHFINMSTKSTVAPGVVLTIDEFRRGKW